MPHLWKKEQKIYENFHLKKMILYRVYLQYLNNENHLLFISCSFASKAFIISCGRIRSLGLGINIAFIIFFKHSSKKIPLLFYLAKNKSKLSTRFNCL